MRTLRFSPGARARRIFDSSPSVELPLDSARHALDRTWIATNANCGDPVVTHIPDQGLRCRKGKGPHTSGRSGPITISLVLSELFSGYVCVPMLPSRAFSR